jgi:hypothetical protein
MDNVDLCTTWYKKMKKHIWLLWWWGSFTHFPEKISEKTTELNEVAIIRTKKTVEQKADRTILIFGQPSLNTGSVLEGIKKLPGLIASDIAGMMYQGKQLDVLWTEDH